MAKKVEETRRLTAVDATGNEYIVIEYTTFSEFYTSDGPGSVEGHRHFETEDGYFVEVFQDGRLFIRELRIVLKGLGA